MAPDDLIEITDLLLSFGADGERRPVRRDEVLARCDEAGDSWAARLVSQLAVRGDELDPDQVDRLYLAVHGEIQRLSEEFRHGARMWTLLEPVIGAIRRSGAEGPVRVVDVGCGTGYVIRWLAREHASTDLEFIGVDFNAALVAEADRLAAAEGIACAFHRGDAFALDDPATVLISTGVLHHFRGQDLPRFFEAHGRSGALAFIHTDFAPSVLAGAGSWMFHRTRMRLGVSRHDGIRSAQRAHPRTVIREAAANAGPFDLWFSRRTVGRTPLPCVFATVVGASPAVGALLPPDLGRPVACLEPVT